MIEAIINYSPNSSWQIGADHFKPSVCDVNIILAISVRIQGLHNALTENTMQSRSLQEAIKDTLRSNIHRDNNKKLEG